MRDEVAAVVSERGDVGTAVPVVEFADIAAGTVPAERMRGDPPQRVRRRARHVRRAPRPRRGMPSSATYLDDNDFMGRYRGPADELFSALSSGRPQIYGVYWSRPQIAARQHEHMVTVRRFLNSFWVHDVRRDDGGSTPTTTSAIPTASAAASRAPRHSACRRTPTRDRSSAGCCPRTKAVYRHVFDGDWDRYDPWDGAHRQRGPRVPDDRDVLGVPDVPGMDGTVGDAPRRRRAARHPDSHGDGLPPAAGASGRRRRRRPLRCRQRPRSRRHRAVPRRSSRRTVRSPPSSLATRCGGTATSPRGRRRDHRRAVGQRDVHPGGAVVRPNATYARSAVRRSSRAQPQRLRRRGLRGRLQRPRHDQRPRRDRTPATSARRALRAPGHQSARTRNRRKLAACGAWRSN